MCFLKTTLEFSPVGSPKNFAGENSAYSPYVTPEPSFSRTLQADLIDPLTGDGWDRAVARNPDATIFHSSAWAKVLSETYGHTPHYLSLSHNAEPAVLVPVMEVKSLFTGRRGVCLPFSDFCAPLKFDRTLSDDAMVDHLSDLARERRWKYFEVRGPLSFDGARPSPHHTVYGHKLDLTKSPSELFDAFSSSVHRALRKAERSGLTVEITTDSGALAEFYRLHAQTRRRHGIPPQPFSFFQNIQTHIIERDLGFLVAARLRGKMIATAVFFLFANHAVFKFGASDDRYQEHRPNNLVMWEGIKRAAQLGAISLHLGRTDFEHAGLRRFKLSLGAEEEMLNYFRFDTLTSRWMNEQTHRSSVFPGAVFRRLPLTVNQLAGTMIYPHLH